MNTNRKTALVIMAKVPAPGRVKTRLIPALGAQGAAALASQLLTHTLETAWRTKCFHHIELCLAADNQGAANTANAANTADPTNQAWTAAQQQITEAYLSGTKVAPSETAGNKLPGNEILITPQGEGDLGDRMHAAFERLLRAFDAVIMIGTDAPDMSAELLDQAARNLTQYDGPYDAVFVPAIDGGYTLIGLAKTQLNYLPSVFADIPWSTSEVMTITRDRLQNMDANWHEYAPMADIDEPHDLFRLPAGWRSTAAQRGSE